MACPTHKSPPSFAVSTSNDVERRHCLVRERVPNACVAEAIKSVEEVMVVWICHSIDALEEVPLHFLLDTYRYRDEVILDYLSPLEHIRRLDVCLPSWGWIWCLMTCRRHRDNDPLRVMCLCDGLSWWRPPADRTFKEHSALTQWL